MSIRSQNSDAEANYYVGIIKQGSTGAAAAAGPSDPAPPGYVPMSMASGIIMAFLAMIKFGNEINQQQNELAQLWAKASMGTQQDGTVDLNKGLVGAWFNNGVAAGQSQKDGLQAQAYGYMAGAIAGGAALVGMGISYAKTCTDFGNKANAQLTDQIADATARKTALSGPRAGEFGAGDIPMETPAEMAATRMLKNNLKNGVDENFRGKNPDGSIDADQATRNENVAKQLTGDDLSKSLKAANKRLEFLQVQRDKCDTTQNTRTQVLNSIRGAAESGGTAYGSWQNGVHTADGAQQRASADVAQQNVSQMQGAQDKAISNAQSNHDAANSEAQQLAQALQSMTKA